MIISLRKWTRRFRAVVLFLILTYFLYHVMLMLSTWLSPFDHHDVPEGDAVKVFEHLHEGDGEVKFADRLMFFWWYGE